MLIKSHEETLPVARMCELLGVARSSYYGWRAKGQGSADLSSVLWPEIAAITLEFPGYGYRRVTAELKRRGCLANHKRILRIMREKSLVKRRKRRYAATTDSNHTLPIYPNLAKDLIPVRVNELWVADITYIALGYEFVYLAAILDAFSRKAIGWSLKDTLSASLTLSALRMALATRRIEPGLIHHSDRGVQYACRDYSGLLRKNGIAISMARAGNPYDNAQIESFIATLKREEVRLFEYQDIAEARSRIGHFIEDVYNRKRLHSALGYLPPAEFEIGLTVGRA